MARAFAFIFLLAALILTACGDSANPTPAQPAFTSAVTTPAVIAEGRIEPLQSINLSFATGGRVLSVAVTEGQVLQAGTVIGELEDSQQLSARLAANQVELLAAEQALTDLQDETQYLLAAAQAQKDLATANDQLDRAERRLRNLAGPDIAFYQDRVTDAENALLTAEETGELIELSQARFGYDQALENFEDYERYFNAVQAEIDNCDTSNPDLNCDPNRRITIEGRVWTLETVTKAYNDALSRLRQAELTLAQARRNSDNNLTTAEERLADAQEDLAFALRNDPNAFQVSLAQADVVTWQAAIEDANKRLADALAGPDPELLAIAEARIAAAQAALQATQAALNDLTLTAPFTGTLAQLSLKVGEQVGPGQPVGILADFSAWQVKTDNLTEIEVVRVQPGQSAQIVLDALPDLPLTGTVSHIDTLFEEKRGDVTYTVTLNLTTSDPRIRWGMTAVVTLTGE